MNMTRTLIAAAVGSLLSLSAMAQNDAVEMVERNARQQERIEQGLRSGDLTVREASRLEREAAHVERMQSRALRDGQLTADEVRRIDSAQDHLSRNIRQQREDAQRGDPDSRSARRMADTIDRSGDQQRRIAGGLRSGELTYGEAARLERGQARTNRMQGYAGADGHFGRHEYRHVEHAENRQSRHIWREKHDGQFAGNGQPRGDHHAGGHGRRDGNPAMDSSRQGPQRGWNGEGRRGGDRGQGNFERHARR